jgi:hypothetical protein
VAQDVLYEYTSFCGSNIMAYLLDRCAAVVSLLALCAGTAQALPVRLTPSEFITQTAGLAKTVETFEGFAAGIQGSPLTLANGVYTASAPTILNFLCATNACLLDNFSIEAPRTFSDLDATFWGTELVFRDADDVFEIIVVGGSGTLTLSNVVPGSFFGVRDDLGLVSVSFRNASSDPLVGQRVIGNYSFDNVTTAGIPSAQVPEPASLALTGLALAGLAAARRRRRG